MSITPINSVRLPDAVALTSCTMIFRYDFSLRYRGYLIVPIDRFTHFECAVLDYCGQPLTDASIEQDFSSPEAVWIAGKEFIDFDIERTLQESPELEPLLRRAGAID